MAKKGLSRLFVAPYSADRGTITYTGGAENEKLASYSLEVEKTEKSNLYLNNQIAESAGGTFAGGTITIETGDLSFETGKMILNLKQTTVDGLSDPASLKETVYDDDMGDTAPNVGVGLIELHQVDGKEFHRAIILPKVAFDVPSDSATTKGESIDWQTQEIKGSIYRADDAKHTWKYYADCTSEDDAVKYIKHKLNIKP